MFRLSPLFALLLAWSSNAFAFPPCPRPPLTLQPATNVVSSFPAATQPWFVATYAVVTSIESLGLPGSGVCTDRAIPGQSRAIPGELGEMPSYAPSSRFGVIALPEFPAIAESGLRVEYGLQFIADAAPLPTNGDWFDLVQLEFLDSHDSGAPGATKPTVYYRVRKRQNARGQSVIEVIETGAGSGAGPTEERLVSATGGAVPGGTVVARVVQDAGATPAGTGIRLRWTQTVRPGAAFNETPLGSFWTIDTTVEVIDSTGQALYRRTLLDQWANGLLIGALNYNVANHTLYDNTTSTEMRDIWMSAYRLSN